MTAIDENASSVNADQGNFIQKAKNLSKLCNIHIMIVCHTNKEKDECDTENSRFNITKKDLNGSGNITNKADIIFGICRNWYKTLLYEQLIANGGDLHQIDNLPDLWLGILKDREEGSRKIIEMGFSKETLRMYDQYTKQDKNEQYEFLNYLDKKYNKEDYLKEISLKDKVDKKINFIQKATKKNIQEELPWE